MNKLKLRELIKRAVISAGIIAVLLFLLYTLYRELWGFEISRESIQEFVAASGAVAPLVFILISFLQVTLVPIPGAITILAGSLVFGAYLSFLYSYIGMMLGAMLAFFLGRVIGRPFANWLAGSRERVDFWLERLGGREKPIFFLMFFFPLFPDDLLCSIAGIFKMSYLEFFVMQLLTRATSIGGTLLFMSGEIIPFSGWGIPVLIVAALALSIGYIFFIRYLNKKGESKRKADMPPPSENSGSAEESPEKENE